VRRETLACCLLLLGAGLLSGPARGEIATIDPVPAATLLLPYFEVDLVDETGIGLTTLFTVTNVSPHPQLARVVLWSDLGVATFGFMVYLTGYDVVSVNLRHIFNGNVPVTADLTQDPGNLISPQGALSGDTDFPACDDFFFPPPPVPPVLIDHLAAAHTGNQSPLDGNCLGLNYGDGVARGYVTLDVVDRCTVQIPGDAGYFVAGGQGEALNDNVLVGEYYLVDGANNFAQGDLMVHIEADGLNPETATPGEYTFYGRYVAWTAADNREPLASTFAGRFLQFPLGGGTDQLVWRDSKELQNPFTCGTVPSPFPLGQTQIVLFDEQENPELAPTFPYYPVPPPPNFTPYAWAATRVSVGGPQLPVAYSFGWLYDNLNTTTPFANPPEDPQAAQAWVTTVHSAFSLFSVGHSAVQLDSAANANSAVVEPPP
jgi:hypothetical protein